MEVDAYVRTFLNISSCVPNTGALPQGPKYRSPPTMSPIQEPPTRSPIEEPPTRSPHGTPRTETPLSQSPISFIFQNPRYMSSPPDYRLHSVVKRPLCREMSVFGAFLNISSRVSSEGVPPPPRPYSLSLALDWKSIGLYVFLSWRVTIYLLHGAESFLRS